MESSFQFPLKINENLFMSDIKSITNDYLQDNKITHIILIDKYLELENDIDSSNYQIMSLEIENPKPEDNFLFGFSSISVLFLIKFQFLLVKKKIHLFCQL